MASNPQRDRPSGVVHSQASCRRAVVVADHRLVSESLSALLRKVEPALHIATANSLEQALALLDAGLGTGDLVFVDPAIGDRPGIDVLEAVVAAAQGASVAVICGNDKIERMKLAMRKGARGFIPRSCSSAELMAALRALVRDGHWYPPKAGALTRATSAWPPRGIQIVRMLEQGMENKAIAARLAISPETVKWHVSDLIARFGVRNRTALVARARADGVLD